MRIVSVCCLLGVLVTTLFAGPTAATNSVTNSVRSSFVRLTYRSIQHKEQGYALRQTSDIKIDVTPLVSDIELGGQLCPPNDAFECLRFDQFEFALPRDFKGDVREWRHGNYAFKLASPLSSERVPRDAFIIEGSCITHGTECSFDFQFVYSLTSGLLEFTRLQQPREPQSHRPIDETCTVVQPPGLFAHPEAR